MPKVTEAHLEARRQQILVAAQACFSRKGIHQTSMQDICRESGLSAGAVYSYFSGKEQIIAATCEGCQEENRAFIESVRSQGDDPLQTLELLIDHGFASLEQPDFLEHMMMMVHLWSESLTSPDIRSAYKTAMYETWIDALEQLITEAQSKGQLAPTISPNCVATMMVAAWHGMVLHKTSDNDIDAAACASVLKSWIHGHHVGESDQIQEADLGQSDSAAS